MPRMFKITLAIAALALLGGLLTWAFVEGRKEVALEQVKEAPIKPASRVTLHQGMREITLNPEAQAQNGIKTQALQALRHQASVTVYGVVPDLQSLLD